MNLIKKLFVTTVIFSMVLALTGINFNVASAANLSAGMLVKRADMSAVYYLYMDGTTLKRETFPNSATYFSWFKDFSGVVTITADELGNIPLGKNATVRPGTYLIKITTDPKVYAVEKGGVLRWIDSEATAKTLYGNNWASMIIDMPDAFFAGNYNSSNAVANKITNQHPAGTLIEYANSESIYYVVGNGSKRLVTAAGFTANKFNEDFVVENVADTVSYTNGTDITTAEAELFPIAEGTTVTPTSQGSLSVSLAANTPAATTVINGQSIAPLASFNFTASSEGSVTVTSLKLKRIGVSSDAVLSSVYLYEGNTKLTDAGSLASGVVTFSRGTAGIITIPAGTTKTITVRSDIGTGTGTVGISILSAADVVTGNTVSGTFPINGNLMSPTTVTDLGRVAIGTVSGVGSNINAGTMNATVWTAPLNVSNQKVNLSYVNFKQVGSISADALQNLRLYVNGVQVGNSATISSDNRVIFDFSNSPVLLNTGATNLELRADIVKGSSRTFMFNIQLASDIVVTDNNYGVNVAATGVNTMSTQTTINPGSISIASDTTFTQTQVVKNSSATFAKFTMKAFGEDMKVNNLIVKGMIEGAVNTEGINSLAIYVNGAQVGSTQNFVMTSGVFPSLTGLTGDDDEGYASFGTNNLFTIPAGTTANVEIRGTLNQVSASAITSVQTNIILAANQAEGVSSITTYPTTTAIGGTGTSLTVVAGNLTTAPNSAFQSQTVIKNTSNQKIGSFVMKAGSAEGVRVTNIRIALGGTLTDFSTLANLKISENATPVQPQGTNNFPVDFTIPLNGTKTIDVFADLGEIAAGTSTVATLTATAMGATTNQSITSGNTAVGQTITIQAGTLNAPTSVSNAPLAQLVVGGTSQVAGTYKFVANNGTPYITEMVIHTVVASATTSETTAISSLTIGSITAPVVDGVATFTGLMLPITPGTQGTLVPVTAAFNNVTTATYGGAVSGTKVRLNLVSYKYLVGNVTTPATTDVATNVMKLVASKPTVALSSNTPAGMSSGYAAGAGSELLRFTVSASNGAVNLKRFTLRPTYSGSLTATSTQYINVYDSEDLSTPLYTGNFAIGNSGDSRTYVMDNDYTVGAGQARTLVVKADTSGLTGGNSIRMDVITADVAGTADNSGDFGWNDGTISTYLSGYLVKTLPIQGNTFTTAD